MEQVSGFARRLQLSSSVATQAAEFYRLAEVKGMLGVRGMSSTGLALICLQISSSQQAESFDKGRAQKLSGLGPRVYTSAVQSVGKMLNLSASTITLREMAVRFGCLEAEQLAVEILQRYKDKMESVYSDIQKESLDFTKSLYLAAALYTACKAKKFRSEKSQFQSIACCPSKSVFQTVLDQMKDCVPNTTTDEGEKKSRKRKKPGDKTTDAAKETSILSNKEERDVFRDDDGVMADNTTSLKFHRETLQDRIISSPLSKDYLQWKETVLAKARAKLQTITTQ